MSTQVHSFPQLSENVFLIIFQPLKVQSTIQITDSAGYKQFTVIGMVRMLTYIHKIMFKHFYFSTTSIHKGYLKFVGQCLSQHLTQMDAGCSVDICWRIMQ